MAEGYVILLTLFFSPKAKLTEFALPRLSLCQDVTYELKIWRHEGLNVISLSTN